MIHIHYRASDGEIFGWENTQSPVALDGHQMVSLDSDEAPNPDTHKVDPASLMLVEKTPAEIATANAPTLRQLQEAVFKELCRTDSFVVPDRPMTDAVRAAWAAYRQTLRDLSKLAVPVDMVNAWTIPPDNNDPIVDLRNRVSA